MKKEFTIYVLRKLLWIQKFINTIESSNIWLHLSKYICTIIIIPNDELQSNIYTIALLFFEISIQKAPNLVAFCSS